MATASRVVIAIMTLNGYCQSTVNSNFNVTWLLPVSPCLTLKTKSMISKHMVVFKVSGETSMLITIVTKGSTFLEFLFDFLAVEAFFEGGLLL